MNINQTERPRFPRRAVITAGMPYGNKDLHFGHIGGVFVHADIYARFLRDRIGAENVIFVSGTDCYGSPIVEYHRQAAAAGSFQGDINDFVVFNHKRQREVLERYQISLNLYAASGFSRSHTIHQELCGEFLQTLYRNGHLIPFTLPQFFDPEFKVFLNGRQVTGQCPVVNCASETAYADECALGHQITAQDLINPRSTLSGKKPEMRDVTNWYIDLEKFRANLTAWVESIGHQPGLRHFVVSSLGEFLQPPAVFVLNKLSAELDSIASALPAHRREESKSKSVRLVFNSLSDREKACEILAANSIRFRTGKTLVPFRLTGNLDWGLKAPDLGELKDLTFWVWPESLIAPVSFTKAYLENKTADQAAWKSWWQSADCEIYQFIGEDNLYFYGIAEIALFLGMQGKTPLTPPPEGQYQLPQLVVNNHILFLDTKASSSGKVKPPMARDLLDYYTSDQLRAHFFSLSLGVRSVGLKPKHLNPAAAEKDGDPVLKEGNLLCNVLNRAVRSCFYTTQQYYDGKIPQGTVSAAIEENTNKAILEYEANMYNREFHKVMAVCDNYIREINKYWAKGMQDDNAETKKQVLIDTIHMVKAAVVLMHPVAPAGTELVREYLNLGENFWDWAHIFDPIYALMEANHRLKFIEPRFDFFAKHPSQFA